MIYTLDFVAGALLAIGLGIAVWWFVVAYKYKNHIDSYSFTRGANVIGSQKKAQLSCDSGHNICVYRATMIYSDPQPGNFEAIPTDPIASGTSGSSKYGDYDPTTTVSLTDKMGQECNGKSQCSYDFSKEQFPKVGTYNPDKIQLISSYTCIPSGVACVSSTSN